MDRKASSSLCTEEPTNLFGPKDKIACFGFISSWPRCTPSASMFRAMAISSSTTKGTWYALHNFWMAFASSIRLGSDRSFSLKRTMVAPPFNVCSMASGRLFPLKYSLLVITYNNNFFCSNCIVFPLIQNIAFARQ